jgi:hypothetical protein
MDFFQTEELDELIDVFKKGNITYGGGEVVYSVGIPQVQNLNAEQSSLLAVTKPTISEEFIPIENYKVIPLTINNYLMANAFVNENAMSVLVAYLLKSMEVAKKVEVRNAIIQALSEHFVDAGFQIEVAGKEISEAMSGLDANGTKTYNTNLLYQTLKTQVKNIAFGKGGGSNTGKYVTSNDLVAIMNTSTYSMLEINTLATLLNSDKATANIRIVVVEDGFDDAYESLLYNGVIWVVQRSALRFGFNYEVATSFFDASNLNTNHWLHFAYYSRFVASGVGTVIKCTNFALE